MSLPRFVSLKSANNNKYLRYRNEEDEVRTLLQFSGDEVTSYLAKFEIELAKIGNGLVHIRSCYSNKYLRRWSPSHWWISAAADEIEEDTSQWSCTLFKPTWVDDGAKTVRLLHVQLGQYASLKKIGAPYDSCLFAELNIASADSLDIFQVLDWESIVILPKYVAFKGDNGKYLNVTGVPFNQFTSVDAGDPPAAYEVFTTGDGSVRIKNISREKFWRLGPPWIFSDSDDKTSTNISTLFRPVKVSDTAVAFLSLSNNFFCRRNTNDISIIATHPAISIDARFEVTELVISRSIYNVKYRLADARIYNRRSLTMDSRQIVNMTQQVNDNDVKLSYTDKKSSAWNDRVSLKLDVKTRLKAGVPVINANGEVEISDVFEGEYVWGEVKETSVRAENAWKVTVLPLSTATVSMAVTTATFDVPFSYSRRDTLFNGKQVIYDMDDGVFTGVNSFDFKFKAKQEKFC